jgi:hypothetical protein
MVSASGLRRRRLSQDTLATLVGSPVDRRTRSPPARRSQSSQGWQSLNARAPVPREVGLGVCRSAPAAGLRARFPWQSTIVVGLRADLPMCIGSYVSDRPATGLAMSAAAPVNSGGNVCVRGTALTRWAAIVGSPAERVPLMHIPAHAARARRGRGRFRPAGGAGSARFGRIRICSCTLMM